MGNTCIQKRAIDYFKEICSVPHGTGNTSKLREYLVNFAKKHNLRYICDDYGNIVIKKDGIGESVILQGHLDMVCESDNEFDFENTPLTLIEDGDFLRADGTTLGADDGIAIGIILAILENDSIKSPPIEAVFTDSEEIGLVGASKMDMSILNSKIMIGLDNEKEGLFTVSSAGGCRVNIDIPICPKEKIGTECEITISGLKGGHSGLDINKQRANANRLIAELLKKISEKAKISVAYIKGGSRPNVIPSDAKAIFIIDEDDKDMVQPIIDVFIAFIKGKYHKSDDGILISTSFSDNKSALAFDTQGFINFICECPDGLLNSNKQNEPLTSINLGTVMSDNEKINICFSVRSNVADEKQKLLCLLSETAEKYSYKLSFENDYPGWDYNEDSQIRDIALAEYKNLYGTDAEVNSMHAGLECGLFASKIKGLDIISIGPDIFDVHSTSERLSIKSFYNTCTLIQNILISIADRT